MTCTLMKYPPMRCTPVRCMSMRCALIGYRPMRHMPVRCTPIRCILYEIHAPIRCTRMKRTLMRYISCEIHVSALAAARLMERP